MQLIRQQSNFESVTTVTFYSYEGRVSLQYLKPWDCIAEQWSMVVRIDDQDKSFGYVHLNITAQEAVKVVRKLRNLNDLLIMTREQKSVPLTIPEMIDRLYHCR